jgi:hypothetical protein
LAKEPVEEERALRRVGVVQKQKSVGNVSDAYVNALNTGTSRAVGYRQISERPEVSNKYLHEARVLLTTRAISGRYWLFPAKVATSHR